MKITVLGASGKTGTHVVKQALQSGYVVNALVHNNQALTSKPRLNLFLGDATNVNDIVKASKGTDVIISTLGPGSSQSQLMTKAVKAIIEASKTTGIKRFILMSSFATQTNHLGTIAKLMAKMMKTITDDKIASETILKKSELDWTIVYATLLTNDPKGSGLREVPDTEKIGINQKIARADVAAWILKEAEENAHIKGQVIISK